MNGINEVRRGNSEHLFDYRETAVNSMAHMCSINKRRQHVKTTCAYVCVDQPECGRNPCQNGGTCVDLLDDYVCRCIADKTTGRNCKRRE
jgi:EGF-like domain